DTILHLLHELIHFMRRNRSRLVRFTADETSYLAGVFNQMPGFIRHLHLYQHIARKETTLGYRFMTVFYFYDFFSRHQNLAKLLLHAGTRNTLRQGALHALFHTGIGMHDIPTLFARGRYSSSGARGAVLCIILNRVAHYLFQPKIRSYNTTSSTLSVPQRKIAITTTKPNTTAVICNVSRRDGHTTFLVSRTASLEKFRRSRPGVEVHASATATTNPPTNAAARMAVVLSDNT